MTLPDIAWNGARVISEMREIHAMRTLDRVTARTAGAMAANTSDADRASRLSEIAEKANLRAQLRTEQLRAAFRLEISSRGAGVGSTALMVREEYLNDESAAHRLASWLQLHCLAMHR